MKKFDKDLAGEIWVPVKGYEGLYEISNLARVKTLAKVHGRQTFAWVGLLNQKFTSYGYYSVSLSRNKKVYQVGVHRLIAIAFILNPENKPYINHKNGIKTDNRIENLEWCTNDENITHGVKIGSFHKGENARDAKLKNQEVVAILTSELPHKELAERFNVTIHTVRGIKYGKSWTHITGKPHFKRKRKKHENAG